MGEDRRKCGVLGGDAEIGGAGGGVLGLNDAAGRHKYA